MPARVEKFEPFAAVVYPHVLANAFHRECFVGSGEHQFSVAFFEIDYDVAFLDWRHTMLEAILNESDKQHGWNHELRVGNVDCQIHACHFVDAQRLEVDKFLYVVCLVAEGNRSAV